MMRLFKTLLKFGLLFGVLLRGLFGYIDPNTGGMLFQLLAVLVASLSAIILFFSRQIRAWVARMARMVRGKSNE